MCLLVAVFMRFCAPMQQALKRNPLVWPGQAGERFPFLATRFCNFRMVRAFRLPTT